MGVKPGYKRTEVGVIPEEWEVSTVGREFDIQLGKMLDAEKNVGIAKPYLGNKSVQWGRVDTTELQTMRMSPADLQRFRLCRGDLLVCEGGEVGRAALWEDQLPECYYQKALHRLRPLNGFDSRLMVACLRFWVDHEKLGDFVSQTSIAHLTKEKFSQVPMAVPPREEQRAIATALSDADVLLTQLDRLIAKKRDIKRAAMQQLLTGKTRLPGFDGEWRTGTVGDVVEALEAGVSVNSLDDPPTPGAPSVLKTSAVSAGKFLPEECKRITAADIPRARINPLANTILISRMNTPDLVGEVAYVPVNHRRLFLPDRLWMTRFKPGARVDARWLAYLLSSRAYQQQIKAAATGTSGSMKNISKDSLLSIPVPFPEHEEQTAIATLLSDLDAELAALEARRDKTRALKLGMMQELLTGRTRLV